jgi:hypothetical protein
MDEVFEEVEIRQLIEEGRKIGRRVMVAELSQVTVKIGVPPKERQDQPLTDFGATVKATNEMFAVLPLSQKKSTRWELDSGDYYQLTPVLYSAYQTSDGVVEFFENSDSRLRKPRGGGLVLVDNKIIVVSREDIGEFVVGQNCQAIEVTGFTVNSETYEDDLQEIENTPTLSGLSPGLTNYASFVVTFSRGEITTSHVISIYNHFNKENNTTSGSDWVRYKLSVRHATEIAQQLVLEKKYDSFDLAVPDAGYFSAVIVADQIIDDESQLSRFRALWSHPHLIPEVPKYFLATHK